MSDPFDNINLLRIILEDETDANSPGSEELMSQVRENWEVLLMLFGYTGDDGTATSDPPNDTTGVLTDTGAAYGVDEHNGRSLVIIDGLAAGNIYTIDDTTATTLICTGDNLYSDGVRQNDEYKIFFNLKNPTGHTHDDVDSPLVNLPDGTLMLPFYMCETDAISGPVGGGYTPVIVDGYNNLYRVYVPPNAQKIRVAANLATTGGSGTMGIKIDVGGTIGEVDPISTTSSMTWYTDLYVDVSALSGWYDLVISIKAGNRNANCRGFSMYWEN